jgi:hypothetical protein
MYSLAELWVDLNDQRRNLCPVSKVRIAGAEENRLTYFAEPPVLGCFEH